MKMKWLILICVISLVCGCAAKCAKGSAEAIQGAGFQSASGNRGQVGDVGDRAGKDIIKTDMPVFSPATQKQTSGIRYEKSIINDRWSIVIFFLGFVLLRELFSYLRMRLKF